MSNVMKRAMEPSALPRRKMLLMEEVEVVSSSRNWLIL